MDFDLLRTFVAVADVGGFTKAGARLHKTQSTISQQIARLERDLGQALFMRDTRRVALTEEGERYLGYARRILALDAEARAALSARVTFLRLGVPEDFAMARLPTILKRFAVRNRGIRLEVVAALSTDLRARLEEGRLDLAILKETEAAKGAIHAWREPLHWIAKADAPFHVERPVPLVAFPQGCVYRCRAVEALEAAGLGWRLAYESPNWSGIKAAVEGGIGISLLADTRAFQGVRRLTEDDGFPAVEPTRLALHAHGEAGSGPAAELLEEIARMVPEERPVVAA